MDVALQEKYKINPAVTLEEVGAFLNDAMDYLDDEDKIAKDCLRDSICAMHMKLFPNAWSDVSAKDQTIYMIVKT